MAANQVPGLSAAVIVAKHERQRVGAQSVQDRLVQRARELVVTHAAPEEIHEQVTTLLQRAIVAVTLAHIAEAPDAAHHVGAHALRLRVALEDAAVLELQQIGAGGLGVRV